MKEKIQKTFKRGFVHFAASACALLGAPETTFAQNVTATAMGDLTPPMTLDGSDVKNGDFLIQANLPSLVPVVGDGADERTTWSFDFTSFPASTPITSALLTLTLTPASGIITDAVRISGLPFVATSEIQNLPVGVTSTIQVELLEFYGSADIQSVLTANGGLMPMYYADDSIVSFARLDLTSPMRVPIDIKPGGFPNSIAISSRGVIPVAILGTAALDVTHVDSSTVCFGDAEDSKQRDCAETHAADHMEDVNGDGYMDLVLHFETQQTGIDAGDTEACLSCNTNDGTPIEGCDSVKIIF